MSATRSDNRDRRSVLRAAANLGALSPGTACAGTTGRFEQGTSGKAHTRYFHAYGPARSRPSSAVRRPTVNLHPMFMATAMSILPLVLAFLFLQRWLAQGVAQTGIKG